MNAEKDPQIKEVSLSAEARTELASCFYAKWSEAFDVLKKAKAATWESSGKTCPRGDWPLFYASNLQYAQTELDKWKRLSDEVIKYSPLIEQMRDVKF